MKLVSLNIWGGMRFETLMEFVKAHAADTDIFCFQEVFDTPSERVTSGTDRVVRANLFAELAKALPDLQGYFVSHQDGKDFDIFRDRGLSRFVDFDLYFGNAIFVKKNIEIVEKGEFWVYRGKNAMVSNDPAELGKSVQWVRYLKEGKKFTICNFHGLWLRDDPKTDNEHRLRQSQMIKSFLASQEGEKIICGDFNLRPDTKSLAMLADGMRNMISEFNISTTRSELYTDRFKYDDHFADYTFVSSGITVKKFEVPHVLASDHLPMILDFT